MTYKKHLLIFLFFLSIGCEEEDKKAAPITSTGSKNINQVIGLKDDDKIEVLNQKTTSQDLYNFMNPKEAIKNAKKQKDSIKKDSLKIDSIKKLKRKKRKKRKSKKGKNKTTHNMPYNPPVNPPVLKKKKLSQGGQSLNIKKYKQRLYKAKIERTIILNPSKRTQISLRLEEPVKLSDQEEIPKYYEITGYTTLNQDRLIVNFQNTIINDQVVNISDVKIYDTDKILGLKVYLKEVQNKRQIVSTASKIASNVTSIALKSATSSIANTVVKDAQAYGSEKIYNNITIEKNRPLFLEFSKQELNNKR